jgi:hypothetical protein
MKNEGKLSTELDLLPEHIHYKDEGCEMSSSCLSCPLANCIFDTPHGKQALLKRRRDDEIARLYRREHPTRREMAHRFGVSTRTVQRALKGKGIKR